MLRIRYFWASQVRILLFSSVAFKIKEKKVFIIFFASYLPDVCYYQS